MSLHLIRTRPGDPAVLVCQECDVALVVNDMAPNVCPGCGAEPCEDCVARLLGKARRDPRMAQS